MKKKYWQSMKEERMAYTIQKEVYFNESKVLYS